MSTRLLSLITLALALLAGLVTAQQTRPEVNVYSSRSHYGEEDAFRMFERETGIKVNLFGGSTSELYERLRAEGPFTPADAFIAVDAGNLWLAAAAGLLQPVDSPVLRANIPAHLRDPENRWFGLTVRARTIMYSTARVNPSELSTYAALGDPKWRGRLCLRTSNHVYNMSFVATQIAHHGLAATEQMLRAWIANRPTIIGSDTPILEAIAAGQCDVGLTNTYYLGRIQRERPDFPVAPFWTDQDGRGTHVNISGAGVTRYAKNRSAAVRLIEYLTGPAAQASFAAANSEYPANPAVPPAAHIAAWGAFRADQIQVAETGSFQAQAVRLMNQVGWR